MILKDVERDDINFICETINAVSITHIDHMSEVKFSHTDLCRLICCGLFGSIIILYLLLMIHLL